MKRILIFLIFLYVNLILTAQTYRQINAKLPGIGNQTLTVEVRGNSFIYNNDIVVKEATGRGGVSTNDANMLWTNSIVPYTIDASITGDMLIKLNDAIAAVDVATNLCFRQKTASDVNYIKYRMYITSDGAPTGAAADSPVGMQGGEQLIRIGTAASKGNLIHETLHSLGMYHEQMRSDRDNFITIHQDRMNPDFANNVGGAFDANFGKLSETTVSITYRLFLGFGISIDPGNSTNLSAYDFGSIMHYGPNAFRSLTETRATIEPKIAIPRGVTMGQRTALSTKDILSLNTLYPTAGSCGGSTPSSTSSTTSGISFTPTENVEVGIVPLVPQSQSMSCWLAGTAMMYGWLISRGSGVCLSEAEILRYLPQDLRQLYTNNTGLQADDTRIFGRFGLVTDPPQSYTVEAWRRMPIDYGPLLVASEVNGGAHFRVIVGISGDGTTQEGTILTINDPWEQSMTQYRQGNRGATYTQTLKEFEEQNYRLARRERDIPGAVYIIHYPSR